MKTKASSDQALPIRERIFDAAEYLFGDRGYDGTSLRDIAERAGTRMGMVSYHFQSKETLYEKVVERRASELGRVRLQLLATERRSYAPGAMPVSRIIYAYTWPFLEVSHGGDSGWKSYAGIITNIANSKKWAHLITNNYDAISTVFLSEFKRALPNTPMESIIAGLTFMVNVMQGVAAETGRMDNLSNHALRSTDTKRIFDIMLPFLSAGFERLGTLSGTEASADEHASLPLAKN